MTLHQNQSSTIETLPRTLKREAVSTLRGYAYQVWVSIDQWFQLPSGAALFLEGAEDIDRVGTANADTIQVRHTQATISLNTEYGRQAIKQFWGTKQRETHGRDIRFTYLTTSERVIETNATFGGRSGLDTWEHARHDRASAEILRDYLLLNLGADGALRIFLRTASVEDLQRQLFCCFFWVTKEPSIDVVSESILDRLSVRLSENGYPRQALVKIRDKLFAYCWELICKPELVDRVLTQSALDTEIENASNIHFTLPLHAVGSVLTAAAQLNDLQGFARSIALLAQDVPVPPQPLLNRSTLVSNVVTHLRLCEPVLLTGSVFKGKTTIAILAALAVCPDAWWIDLTGRQDAAVREIFGLLASLIESKSAPKLIILDDLNTSQTARKIYRQALIKLFYRAKNIGKSVLLTAQGSSEILEKEEEKSGGLIVLDIPSMTSEEIQIECTESGCSSSGEAERWAKIIQVQTGGHPKLVQVRIEELADSNWPIASVKNFFNESEAVQSAKELARSLFSESVMGAEADFVYTAAEFTIFPSKQMLLNLAGLTPGIQGADGLIRKLTGKWLETIAGKRFRVTPILRAEIGDVWTKERRRQAHQEIYDSIANCESLAPVDGAALVFHGMVSRDPSRLAGACAKIVMSNDEIAKNKIFQELSWIVAIEPPNDESIFPEDETAAFVFRSLQFQVGALVQAKELNQIAKGWRSEIERSSGSAREGGDLMFNFSVLTTSARLSPRLILSCATWAHVAGAQGNEGVRMFEDFSRNNNLLELPATATIFQTFLAVKMNMVGDYTDFVELVDWVEESENVELLREFNDMVSWTSIKQIGAFVHSGWIAEGKLADANWNRWITVLEKAWTLAKASSLLSLGFEVARALSIIHGEYLAEFDESLAVIERAVFEFGSSVVLAEQRANAYFQNKDFGKALDAWQALTREFGNNASKDPFAYRCMGIAAVELQQWEVAANIFESGADVMPTHTEFTIKCGLLAEAALAKSLAGNRRGASSTLVKLFNEIPSSNIVQESPEWEATLRMMGAIATQIRGHQALTTEGIPYLVKPGMASNPQLKMKQMDSNHVIRMGMLELDIFIGEMSWVGATAPAAEKARSLLESKDLYVKWLAALNLIIYEIEHGTTGMMVRLAEVCLETAEAFRKDSPSSNKKKNPQSIVAGLYLLMAISSENTFPELLQIWESALYDNNYHTSKIVFSHFRAGYSASPMLAKETVFNEDVNRLERCGAALSILQSQQRDAQATAGAQALLTSLIQESGTLITLQNKNCEEMLAKQFAKNWVPLLDKPHLFKNPQNTLPLLKAKVELALEGKGGLKLLLASVSDASGIHFSDIINTL